MILSFVKENGNSLSQFGATSFTRLLIVNLRNYINFRFYLDDFLSYLQLNY